MKQTFWSWVSSICLSSDCVTVWRYWQWRGWQDPYQKCDSTVQVFAISVHFLFFHLHPSLPPTLPSWHPHLQPVRVHWLLRRHWLFVVAEQLFLFVPFLPWLPAHRLAAPCVKGGCSRTDCGNSRLASPGPLLPNQRGNHQSSSPPALHTHWSTNTQMPNQTHTHTKSLQRSHRLPIILGSNFISTRVAAHCRQPLQSFLINSRFVPHPSFWTHLSYIPINAAPSTPRQPPFANPTASPTSCPTLRNSYCLFFPTCRSPTYRVR